MILVNTHEAKSKLSQLLAQAEAGETVIICRNGQKIAHLKGISAETSKNYEVAEENAKYHIKEESMHLSDLGQVSIPQHLCEQLQLQAGTEFDFNITTDGTIPLIPKTVQVDSVFGMLKSFTDKCLSIEEMNDAVSARMKKTYL